MILVQLRYQRFQQAVVLPFHHLLGDGVDLCQLLSGRFAVQSFLVIADIYLIHEAGDTHHKKLIQVGGCDRQKFQPVHDHIGLVIGLLQYPVIKIQPASLSVNV